MTRTRELHADADFAKYAESGAVIAEKAAP
jgi:hypothetical protein